MNRNRQEPTFVISQSARIEDSASTTDVEREKPRATVVPRATLRDATIKKMYALYAANYADTSETKFRRDLADKTHVLLLGNAPESLCGFSTLQLYKSVAAAQRIRIVYSGDTIIDPASWGSSALAFEWLRFAGETFREEPEVPLYWLLIVKGHRTYRFLSTFARNYVPNHKTDSDVVEQRQLLNALAIEKFGEEFDPDSGVVRPAMPAGRLNKDLAEIPDRHQRLAVVQYFLQRNPEYRRGDELVCICRLAPDNLKPLALRVFAPTDN